MPLPNAKTRIKKSGVTFENKINQAEYLITELSRAALRDTAKFLRKRVGEKLINYFKDLYVYGDTTAKRAGKLKRSYPRKATQYWLRKREQNLVIGFKQKSWYGSAQELGDKGTPKKGFLRDTTFDNIAEIKRIQAQYLSALNDKNPADPSDEEYKSED